MGILLSVIANGCMIIALLLIFGQLRLELSNTGTAPTFEWRLYLAALLIVEGCSAVLDLHEYRKRRERSQQ